MHKFVGEYVSAVKDEEMVYDTTGPHLSMESAAADARAKSKAAHVIEWVAVKEYEWRGDKRGGEWECIARYYGDYDQLSADA